MAAALLAALCLSMTTGCKSKQSDDNSPVVYVINAIPGTSQLRMSLSGQKILTGPGFDGAIRAFDCAPGEYTAAITALKYTGGDIPLPVQTIHIQPGHRYAYVVGTGTQAQRTIFDAADKSAKPNTATLTVVNASPDASSVDVSLNTIVSFNGVPFTGSQSANSLAPGNYQIAALASGDAYKPLTDPVAKQIKAGKSYTIFVTGSQSEHGVSLQMIEN